MTKFTMRKLITILMSSLAVILIAEWTDVGSFIKEQKEIVMQASAAPSDTVSEDALMTRIREEAKQRYVAPIDAQVDRVWKAIPGYNGLEVDVDASYKKTKEAGKDAPLQLVYREVPPKITLDQLPPQPIFKGNSNKAMASIMINVAWGSEYIEPMLNTLKKEQVKATFFFDGSWVRKNPELAKKIADEGHEIGNHAYSHPKMSHLDESRQREEISKAERYIKEATGVNSKWFAPPSGDLNATTLKVANQLGMKTVLWTADTIDWQKPSPATIIERIRNKTGAGMLILMHPTAPSSQALGDLIQMIKKRSLTLGTVSETLSESRIMDGKVE
ncbi:polysaccharide deacetylase family protein [Paenibacillus marinisediminis]